MNPLSFANFTNMTLLQVSNTEWFSGPSSGELVFMLIGIGGIVIFGIVYTIKRRLSGGPKTSSTSTGSIPAAPRKFNFFAYRRIAAAYNLNKDQARLLEQIFANDSVDDPEKEMANPALLDKHFLRTYKIIERNTETDEQVQQRHYPLFALRNAIEAAPDDDSDSISSTKDVPENSAAMFTIGKGSYPVRVIRAKGETLIVTAPKNTLGTPINMVKGNRITLSFYSKSSKGYTFESRIVGTTLTPKGAAVELVHSTKPKAQIQRRFRRKQTSMGCACNLVYADSTKKRRKKDAPKLTIDPRRFTGTVLDISVGGCSLKTAAPIQVGSQMKIEIVFSRSSHAAVLGQVLRTNRSSVMGTILYIKFIKVPRRSYNYISAHVFGYD